MPTEFTVVPVNDGKKRVREGIQEEEDDDNNALREEDEDAAARERESVFFFVYPRGGSRVLLFHRGR